MINWRNWFGPKGGVIVVTDPPFDPDPQSSDLVDELRRLGTVKVGTPFKGDGDGWGPPLTKLLNDAAAEIESYRHGIRPGAYDRAKELVAMVEAKEQQGATDRVIEFLGLCKNADIEAGVGQIFGFGRDSVIRPFRAGISNAIHGTAMADEEAERR